MTESETWHYGLVARWWAEFNVAEPHELAYYREIIRRFGQPVLDLGCGTGRIMLPLLQEGFDVDGSDVSADMIAKARGLSASVGVAPRLTVQPMHELATDRSYRTVYICGAYGLGSTRDQDRETLRRVHHVLEPGGALLITDHEPFHPRQPQPEWLATGERRQLADGDEIELIARLAEVDEEAERLTREMRARLWRDGTLVAEEFGRLTETDYSVDRLEAMLRDAGFRDPCVDDTYASQFSSADDRLLAVIAEK